VTARALSFPFHPDDHGSAATSGPAAMISEQIEQVLLTIPGERVDRPDFGCGVQLLVFETTRPETLATTEFLVRTQLRRHLAALIDVDAVRVRTDDAELHVDVLYTVRRTGQELAATVSHPLGVPR
jgi:phage baseplate assembly protein W